MPAIQLTLEEVTKLLPTRRPDVHKGSIGKVLVIAGSRSMSGAAILASQSTMRSGAGLTTLLTPVEIAGMIDVQNIEVMTRPLLETGSGTIDKRSLDLVLPLLGQFDVLLIGPGLSGHKSTQCFVRDILEFINSERPHLKTVLDADGLKTLKKIPRPFSNPIIITPHFGELAALAEKNINEIKNRPYYYARQIAERHNVIVVLKSNITYIVEPGKSRYFINNNGNPGMATAGSGDVLSGIIAGLWAANPLSAIQSAAVGPFVHGLAGNIAATKHSIDGIIASDIMKEIPAALKFVKGF